MVNGYFQDRFGARMTMMIFMGWMAAVIAIPCFAPSLPILAWGEAMCGVSWGVFQVSDQVRLSSICHTNIPLLLNRLSLRPTLPKSFPPSSDPTLPLTFACAGAQASSSPLAWYEPYQASREILAGGFHFSSNGSGRFRSLSVLTAPLNRPGTQSDVVRLTWPRRV